MSKNKLTYKEASDIIYDEIRKCEAKIAKKLGLHESDVDIIYDWGYKIESKIIDQCDLKED